MIHRRLFLLGVPIIATTSSAAEPLRLVNFRFGVVREISEGIFEFLSETKRLPRKFKSTGFRWGIGFDNPLGRPMEWYEVVHLPAEPKDVSGNLKRLHARTLRTTTHSSSQPTVIDDFWFDEGDPLGPHRIELFVNGVLRYAVDFQVLEGY
jgi:hypothetical protein